MSRFEGAAQRLSGGMQFGTFGPEEMVRQNACFAYLEKVFRL